MKTDIQALKDSFQWGYDAYYESRLEADEVWNMYHNRQWTFDQAAVLENRGQPKETFNVIKLFARMLVGYYSTVVNSVRARPTTHEDTDSAVLLTDTISSVFEDNNMDVEGDKIKLSAIVSGLMCVYEEPVYTNERDEFGRPIYKIVLRHVPHHQLVLDPMSVEEDYSDARFLHRYKWVSEDAVRNAFGQENLDKITEYYNYLEIPEAEFEYNNGDQFQGRYRVFNSYLITHTVIIDDDNKRWSIWWCGDVELRRDEITFKDVLWHYRVVKLHTSDKPEYYGIFREVVETQKAINQALVKLQLMVNTQKAFVEENSVADMAEFTNAFNRVTGVIPVKKLSGLKIADLSREALEQYSVIDRALDRIQRILSVNDSFLGMAYASDSGRKVKLQQNATVMALRYLTVRIESFYRALGTDVAKLIRQYYSAHQVLRVSDELHGDRYIELNQPMQIWSGEFDEQGQPIYTVAFEQVYHPETGDPEVTEDGELVFAPVPEQGTEFAYADYSVTIDSVTYHDEDERAQLMVESVLQGSIGQMLAQVNPAAFFKASALTMRTMKTKYSPEISKLLEETGVMLGGDPLREQAAADLAQNIQRQSPGSHGTDTRLPQNTNEGVD